MSFLKTSDFNFEDDDNFLASCGVDMQKNYATSNKENQKLLAEVSSKKLSKSPTNMSLSIFEKFKFKKDLSAKENKIVHPQMRLAALPVKEDPKQALGHSRMGKDLNHKMSCGEEDSLLAEMFDSTDDTLQEQSLLQDCTSFDIFFKENAFGDGDDMFSKSRNKVSPTQSSSMNKQMPVKQIQTQCSPIPLNMHQEAVSSTPLARHVLSSRLSDERLERNENILQVFGGSESFENPAAKYSLTDHKKRRKQKFPGPAGLLPDLPPNADLSLLKMSDSSFSFLQSEVSCNQPADADLSLLKKPDSSHNSLYSDNSRDQELVCSQASAAEFKNDPWQNMLKDLSKEMDLEIMNCFNIKNMLKKAKSKLLPKLVVADVLCVIITEITVIGQEADASFKDETGKVPGKIHSDALISFKKHLVPHAVIVLKKAPFLFDRLVIKQQNIVTIYDNDGKAYPISSFDKFASGTSTSSNCKSSGPINKMPISDLQFSRNCEPEENTDAELDSAFNLSQDELNALLQNVDSSCFEDE